MAKGKVTIEIEGSAPVSMAFDDLCVDMSQSIYSFYEYGEYVAKVMAPDGQININITGTNREVRDAFTILCAQYPHYERRS